jgi:hypothetical protein
MKVSHLKSLLDREFEDNEEIRYLLIDELVEGIKRFSLVR